jgi:hypothetical protein
MLLMKRFRIERIIQTRDNDFLKETTSTVEAGCLEFTCDVIAQTSDGPSQASLRLRFSFACVICPRNMPSPKASI